MNLLALNLSALGSREYALIFIGLIFLLLIVVGIKNSKKDDASEEASVTIEEIASPPAPGSAGRLKIYDTPPKTAAMLMAIVANKMDKPLNELRFISIKEVK